MKKIIVMFMFSGFLFTSCYPEPLDTVNQEEQIESSNTDQSLVSYYQTFENEASLRGLSIDLGELDLISRIEEIEEDGIAGTCQFNSQQSNVITIDQTFWNNSSQNIREMVVFHELGHCVLGRGHREDENDENACLSIMNSGTTGCRVFYNDQNREYYLDELFELL